MDVGTKRTASGGWSCLMILCSFSFVIPLFPVPLSASPSASEGLGYRPPTVGGLRKWRGSTATLHGSSGTLSFPSKMLDLMRSQITIFLSKVGWVTQCVCLFGGEESRGWDTQNSDWGTCRWHCVKNCKQLELAMYRKQNSAIYIKLRRFVRSYICISKWKIKDNIFHSLQEK